MNLRLQHDWHHLTGQEVEIWLDGKPVRSGHVDAVTGNGQVLWLQQDGTEHRQLFDRTEGFEVWID